MKRIFQITMVLAFLIGFSFSSDAQMQFGIKAGLNGNNFGQSLEDPDDKIPTKLKLGFHLGVVMDFNINEDLSFSPGLIYTSKGVAFDLEENGDENDNVSIDGKSVLTLNYLEIPLNITYKINDLSLFGGPYIGFGMGGSAVADYTYFLDGDELFSVDENEDSKAVFGEVSEEDWNDFDGFFYNGLDFGLNLGVGYNVGPVMVSLGYSLGLNDLEPKIEDQDKDEDSITNRVINLSATYMFGSSMKTTEK